MLCALVVTALAGLSVLVGLALHWVVPAVDVDAGGVVGAVALVASRRIIAALAGREDTPAGDGDEDDEPPRAIFIVPVVASARRRRGPKARTTPVG